MLMLPGTPITYYGEEIGMEAFHKIPTPYTAIDLHARDRTPFQWCDHPNAGQMDDRFMKGNYAAQI